MMNFVNNGTDDAILKSLPAENCSEDLVKAMSKQGLVQKDVTVQGKNGKTFTRKQWVKASDVQSSADSKQGNDSLKQWHDKVQSGNFTAEQKKELDYGVSQRHACVLQKDGKIKTVKTWDEADYAESKGWKNLGSTTDILNAGKLPDANSGNSSQKDWVGDYTRLTDDKSSGTIEGEAHNMMVGRVKSQKIDPKDKKAIGAAAMEMNSRYRKVADNCKRTEDKYNNLLLANEFSKIAEMMGMSDKDKFVGKTFSKLKENLESKGLKLDSADAADIGGGHDLDHVTLYKGKETFIGTFNRYSNGDLEIINVKPDNRQSDDKKSEKNTKSSKTSKNPFSAVRHGGYTIKYSSSDGTWNIYDAHGGLEDSGFKTVDAARAKIDEDAKIGKPKSGISFKKPADGNTKKAVADMLTAGHSHQDIMTAAKSAGITWKENDHEGINWMRASMAIQKHMQSGGGAVTTNNAKDTNISSLELPEVSGKTLTDSQRNTRIKNMKIAVMKATQEFVNLSDKSLLSEFNELKRYGYAEKGVSGKDRLESFTGVPNGVEYVWIALNGDTKKQFVMNFNTGKFTIIKGEHI